MAIVMVAMLAFGGTYAYFTAESAKTAGKVDMGRVSLKANSAATVTTGDLVPTQQVLQGTIGYTNDSTTSTFIAVKFDVTYTGKVFIAAETNAEEIEATTNTKIAEVKEAYAPYFKGYTDENSNPSLEVIRKLDAQGKEAFNDKDSDGEKEDGENYLVAGYILEVENMPLEADKFDDAFVTKGTGAKLSTLIDSNTWQQGKENTNVYMMINDNSLVIPKEVNTEVEFIDATDKTASSGSNDIIIFDVDRHMINGVWYGDGDGSLKWEDAEVTISFAAYSIQTIGLQYDSTPEADGGIIDVPTTVTAENVDIVWEAMDAEI